MKPLPAILFLIAAGAPGWAATPLEAALAATEDGPDYAYDLTLEDSDTTARLRIDPSLPADQQLTVISPAEDEWTKGFRRKIKRMREDEDGSFWCSQFADVIPTDAALIEETNKLARYSFKPSPSEDKDDDGRMARMAKFIDGIVTVDKQAPGIRAFELVAPKPFKPATVARVDRFRMHVECTPVPDGRMRIEAMTMDVSGSAMFRAFEAFEIQSISNLDEVGTPD